MSDIEVARVFDQAAAQYDRVDPHFFAYFGQRLADAANISPEMNVLDVATGTGAILQALSHSNKCPKKMVGVDLSTGMLQQIARDPSYPVLLGQMDANKLAFPANTFDYVLCGHAIFFFPKAIHEFYRVLKPDGQAGLAIIAKGCLDWLRDLISAYLPPDSEGDESFGPPIDSLDGLRTLFLEAGFYELDLRLEKADLVFVNEEDWWAWIVTLGLSRVIEQMDDERRAAFKKKLFTDLQRFKRPEKLYIPFQVFFAFGKK